MLRTSVRLVFACVAGGIFGLVVGALASVMFASPICPSMDTGYLWGGVVLGAGIGAAIVFSIRPDPSQCNRQDPS